MLKLLFIVGSLRKNSFNLQLAQAAADYLAGAAEVKLLDYARVPFFNEDLESSTPKAVNAVREEVLAADGLWIFTPEYNHSLPGVLKNLLDWLSRPYDGKPCVLQGKPVAFSGISIGMGGTCIAQEHLLALLSFLDAKMLNSHRLTIPNAYSQTDDDGKLHLTTSARFLHEQADAFLEFIAQLNADTRCEFQWDKK